MLTGAIGDDEPKSVAGVECRADDGEADHVSLLTVSRSELMSEARSDSLLAPRSLAVVFVRDGCNWNDAVVSAVVETDAWLVLLEEC